MGCVEIPLPEPARGALRVGPSERLVLIAGPCVIEDGASCLEQARTIARIADAAGFPFIFKASFDKANRTSLRSFRGPGLEEGLKILAEVRHKLGVPVLTDIHSPEQAERAAEVVDVLQVPAFLCRQTDILLAAGRTGRPVNIKKGQFLAPELMAHAAEKVLEGASSAGRSPGGVLLTERGSCFGYGDLVVDMRALAVMRRTGWPVVFDATHSVQKPGLRGGASGGDRSMVRVLARAAAAAGIDAIFVETHPQPSRALSDPDTQLPHEELPVLLAELRAVHEAVRAAGMSPDIKH